MFSWIFSNNANNNDCESYAGLPSRDFRRGNHRYKFIFITQSLSRSSDTTLVERIDFIIRTSTVIKLWFFGSDDHNLINDVTERFYKFFGHHSTLSLLTGRWHYFTNAFLIVTVAWLVFPPLPSFISLLFSPPTISFCNGLDYVEKFKKNDRFEFLGSCLALNGKVDY